ncbi:YqiA/YcfP family alpha/beta fold hydrolase [Leptolyngbya sp. 'hensonii']|uniref:YqiA/YcfP family alpha/beta fold hydrolase n=1 Tax=Leptolyngbya sp. 'hensonii' TaxID=1922337 RepID=UPI0009F8C146|nr:YqiA/YcfP family alpha/beta fold hydrolase [Leptolyngbya sp. 'hensonii']
MTTYLYLHGFASGPRSAKAQYLANRFTELGLALQIPDLNQGDFSHLTLTRQIQQVEAELPVTPVTLIGSSFGGLTAAWLAQRQRQVERLVLLAPAFQFLDHWLPRLGAAQQQLWATEGYLSIYHYIEQSRLPLHYGFMTDAQQYRDEDLQRSVPTLILHGRSDDTIPIAASRRFASARPWVTLMELESDHGLTDVIASIWIEIQKFCALAQVM